MVIGIEKGKRSTLCATGAIKHTSIHSLLLGAASFVAQVLNVAISYCSDVKEDPLHALLTRSVCRASARVQLYARASSTAWCDKQDETGSSTLGVAWIHTKPPVGQRLRRESAHGWMGGWVGVLGTAEWIHGESGELEEWQR